MKNSGSTGLAQTEKPEKQEILQQNKSKMRLVCSSL